MVSLSVRVYVARKRAHSGFAEYYLKELVCSKHVSIVSHPPGDASVFSCVDKIRLSQFGKIKLAVILLF